MDRQVFIPGCTTPFEPSLGCMHNHWRWGASIIAAGSETRFGGGVPPVASDQQSVRVAIVRVRSGEREPPPPDYDVAHLVNGDVVHGEDMVFWVMSLSTARLDQISDRNHMFVR